ncbi:MFS transporter [Photorhabdus luminescens]|uniref:MFS transporter n=1 Tax=Photorhabdus akhurstii TaxID=171438 RepID=UPI000CFA6277|nr:MFS transporter [Photorhabdus luminescens]PQQ34048.1 MFS transporter [Photorhabdus luminescens]
MTLKTIISGWRLALYCLATGLSVASVVYHQSMTTLIADSFNLPSGSLWELSMATQFGYGTGLILGLPLGDMIAPRRLIPATMIALGFLLVLIGFAPSFWLMVTLCFLAGLLSIGGQLLLAYSAKALASEQRSQVVGGLLTSLFAGLLLARVLAGWGGEYIGWRGIYLVVGVLTLLTGLGLCRSIGNVEQVTHLGYGQVLKQQRALWREYSELRHLALAAACFFAASNGIWANLSSLIHSILHWNAGQIGLLAFTSLATLRAAWFSQHLQRWIEWHNVIILLAILLSLASLAGMLNGISVIILLIFLTILDFCVRAVQAIAQSRVLNIDAAAASRLNSLFMTIFFFGAALGSWLGDISILHLGWNGMFLFTVVCVVAGVFFLFWRNPALRLIRINRS